MSCCYFATQLTQDCFSSSTRELGGAVLLRRGLAGTDLAKKMRMWMVLMSMRIRRTRLYRTNLWMETTDPLLDPWVMLDTWDILLISSFFPVNFPSCSDLRR